MPQSLVLKNEPSEELVLPTSFVGVEVELGRTQYFSMGGLWHTTTDGSVHLPEAQEYRFAVPLFGQDVVDALTLFEEQMTNLKPVTSNDTSLHVHIDVRDMTTSQLTRFILLYLMYEELLYSVYCPTRVDNIFCLRAGRTDYYSISRFNAILAALESDRTDRFADVFYSSARYGGININSVSTFGSLEFRGHGATYDKAATMEWINVLLSIKQEALRGTWEVGKPYLMAKHTGLVEYTQHIFGDYATKMLEYEDFYQKLYDGMQLTRIIANFRKVTIENILQLERGME